MPGKKNKSTAAAAADAFPVSIVHSRWLLVLAVSALVAFGSQQQPRLVPHYTVILALVVSNLLLGLLRARGTRSRQSLELITLGDVLIVTVVIGWVDPSAATYVAVFSALILGFALGRVSVIMGLMVLLCAVYAGYLYTEIGAGFYRQVALILRVPFLFSIGLHFATIASYLKTQKAHSESLVLEAKQQGDRARHLASEQERLRALSQIGRLGLSSADADPVRALLEMSGRARKALGAAQSSLILFASPMSGHDWNGRTKDRKVGVRTLPLDPSALDTILTNGKLTELNPGSSKELERDIKPFFPEFSSFGSLLAAPIEVGQETAGVLLVQDSDHTRKYNDGERDFYWTVALLIGAFIQARVRLENELRLRALITNAPVIMFALSADGIIELFEGKGAMALKEEPASRIGKSIYALARNDAEVRRAVESAYGGKTIAGSLELEGTLFETQYSPLRGVDGAISGVMGVTTAILDSTGAPVTPPATAPVPPAAAAPEAPAYSLTAQPTEAPPPHEEAPAPPARPGPGSDMVRGPLPKPLIPLADEVDD